MGVSGVVVNRWRRYGKDRLYVTRADEVKVGWWDLTTNEAHPASPENAAVLTQAVNGWKTEQPDSLKIPSTTQACTPEPASSPQPTVTYTGQVQPPAERPVAGAPALTAEVDVPVHPAFTRAQGDPDSLISPASVEPLTRPWIDLTTNTAGAEAREQAFAARDAAAPVKTFFARVLGVHTDERAWRIGVDGEEKVAGQLAKVAKKDPRWRVLHAIPVGDRGSDIDHLVIGPGGVFTVNTKHHPRARIWVGGDTFMVNGNKQPYIRNSRHEATRAAKLLTAACGFPVHVESIIVTVNAADIVVKKAPVGVHVLPRMQIARWLRRHGEIHGSPNSKPSTRRDAVPPLGNAEPHTSTAQPTGMPGTPGITVAGTRPSRTVTTTWSFAVRLVPDSP